MMIKPKIENALNKQINVEFSAFYSYLSMAAYFESRYMPGCAHWFKIQSKEEFKHAMKLNEYIISRGGKTVLTTIKSPESQWKSCLSVFKDAYDQELHVTSQINSLMNLAQKEQDHATEIMLQWFITEQVEEENTANSNVERIKHINDAPAGIEVFDHELALRE